VHRIPLGFVFTLVLLSGPVRAQEASPGCLWHRDHLTGDAWGLRSGLAERGVVANLYLTQFYQDAASGGTQPLPGGEVTPFR
jgi:hypothetical protein